MATVVPSGAIANANLPLVEYLVHMHQRGVFDRLVISTSGLFCSEQVLRTLKHTIPQVWVVDFIDGQGDSWEALQNHHHVQALLHLRVDECTPLESILTIHPELPIYVGERPSSGNGWWLTPKEHSDFESDQLAESALKEALEGLSTIESVSVTAEDIVQTTSPPVRAHGRRCRRG